MKKRPKTDFDRIFSLQWLCAFKGPPNACVTALAPDLPADLLRLLERGQPEAPRLVSSLFHAAC